MCPTLTVGSFFRHERSTFLFICSTTSNRNNFEPQQLEPQKRVQNKKKKQNRRPEPRNHTKDPLIAPLFFGTMRLFLKPFGLHQRVPPSFFRHFATQWMSKNPKGSPFYIFRHCDTFQKSHFKIFFGIFFKSPKCSPHFFHILQPAGVSQSPRGPPFTILSLRYSAGFGRSRLVFQWSSMEEINGINKMKNKFPIHMFTCRNLPVQNLF